jgi:hypothetical protein
MEGVFGTSPSVLGGKVNVTHDDERDLLSSTTASKLKL